MRVPVEIDAGGSLRLNHDRHVHLPVVSRSGRDGVFPGGQGDATRSFVESINVIGHLPDHFPVIGRDGVIAVMHYVARVAIKVVSGVDHQTTLVRLECLVQGSRPDGSKVHRCPW